MRTWTLICLIALAACSRPPRSTVSTDPQRAEPPKAAAEKEEPDRYRLEQEGEAPPADVEFEEDRLTAPEDTGGEGFDVEAPRPADEKPEAIPPSQSVPIPPKDPNAPPTEQLVRGFRVQLAALTSATEAESARSQAAARLGVSAYVVFEAPLYKVRAGDFVDRADAVALQTRARGYGYPEAWVVATEVRISAP